MSENPPAPGPAGDAAPTQPPAPAPTPIIQTTPVPPAPESGASDEVLSAIGKLTEIVTKLVDRDAGVEPDVSPGGKPWTHWGSR